MFSFKTAFFDVAQILERVDAARHEVLSRAGAFVRRTAKGLILPGKKPAAAGRPPHNHTGLLRERVFFAYDESVDKALVGPEKTNQIYFDHANEPVNGTVPEILEQPEGGQIRVLEVWNGHAKKWHRADLRSKRRLAGRRTRLRTARVSSHPFMRPAMEKNLDKFHDLWGDVVTD